MSGFIVALAMGVVGWSYLRGVVARVGRIPAKN